MTRKEIVSLVILLAVIGFGTYRYVTRSYSVVKSQYLLDTIIRVSATSRDKDVSQKVDKVFNYIKHMQDNLNEYTPGGWLWSINHSQQTRFPMDADAYKFLVLADSLYRLTDGAFDITIKPVFDLWHFDSSNPQVPDSLLIKKTLQKVGFDKIKFDEHYLYKPVGMELTFGSLAKGYILDKARTYMNSLGLERGFIDCHSSMTFFGNQMLPEIVGIQHPRKMNDIVATLKIENNSIGTSGDYQQYFEVNGVRYHHILNAHTGMPVKDVYSVTVINPSAFVADGLSTSMFVLPPEKALDLAKHFPNTEAIIYYQKNGSIVSLKSKGIKAILQSEKG